MLNRQSLINELQEIRFLVWDENWQQAHQHVLLLVTHLDQLIEPIHPPDKGPENKQPVYAADQIGVGLPKARSVRSFVTEAGFALKRSDSRRVTMALDEALRAIDEPAAEG